MQAIKTTETKIVEKIVQEEIKTNIVTLTLTEEEASQMRTLSYTLVDKYTTSGSTAEKIFNGIYTKLCSAGVPQARNCGCNYQHEFVERK